MARLRVSALHGKFAALKGAKVPGFDGSFWGSGLNVPGRSKI